MLSESREKPIYQKIAIDIANRIIQGDFAIDQKLYGRSVLSSQYNVSPETIRKAMLLLNEMEIVEVTKGSGIVVKSVDNCLKFVDKFKDIQSINSMKKSIINLMNERSNIEKNLDEEINNLMDYTNRFNKSNPFTPFEFEIEASCKVLGKTVSETNFWQSTRATIIGIRRNGELILSPGPYAVFQKEDIYIAIGDEESYYKAKDFLSEKFTEE